MESTQSLLARVRPPRVHITYDVETGGAIEKKTLPFIVGVLADLSGENSSQLQPLSSRSFTEIDGDNFSAFMAFIEPKITVAAGDEAITLRFSSIEDFHPEAIVKRIPSLNEILKKRIQLVDLVTKVDSNLTLNKILTGLLRDNTKLQEISTELQGKDPEARYQNTNLLNIISESRMAFDESAKAACVDMIVTLIENALTQKVAFTEQSHIIGFLTQHIALYDAALSHSLNIILHNTYFQKLEGAWRGLHYLVFSTHTNASLKIKVLPIAKSEAIKDLAQAIEFDQSALFKKIYEQEYGTFGGKPYACLVLDYEWDRSNQDIEGLQHFSRLAAAAHTPILTAAHAHMFGLKNFYEIDYPRDISKIFDTTEMAAWNAFRDTEDARYINLFLPHFMARNPYGSQGSAIESFVYEEDVQDESEETRGAKLCWSNVAYVMASRITEAFSQYGWTAFIRGVEGGGKVENLPVYLYTSPQGDLTQLCPTEVIITDRREQELSQAGFIALCHCKGTNYGAFFGSQSAQRPKLYDDAKASSNAMLSARLAYMLTASRFAHYAKVLMRDKIGSFASKDEVRSYLQRWISQYVLLSDSASASIKAQNPLREARVDIEDVAGKPGAYKAVLYIRPHFQLEELTASIRLVAALPIAGQ